MAKKPQDPASAIKDAFSNVDTSAMTAQFKGSAEVGEKLAKAVLAAAEKSNEISSSWAKQTISNMGTVTKVQEDPAQFGSAMTDFASSQGALATENLNAFAEIARSLQAQTIEILMEAGKSASGDAAEAMQKTADMMGVKIPGSK